MDDFIIRKTFRLVIIFLLLYGIYIIFHGHLSPGGGFSGGMILGLGFIMYLLVYGGNLGRIPINIAILLVSIGGITEASKFLIGKNFPATQTPGSLFSIGIGSLVNLGIGLLVAATIIGIFYLEEK